MPGNADAIASAVERLTAEADRVGGPVPYADVLRLGERYGVTPDQVPELCRALAEEEVEIEGAPETTSERSGGNGADQAPSAAELEKLERRLNARRGRKPPLTAEEEQDLGRRIRAGEDAQFRIESGEHDKRPALANLVRDGLRAREKMVERNQGLVRAIVEDFKGAQQILSFDDLVGEGQIGLLRAIAKWDHTRGLKFSTYATWWIFQSISRALADKGRLVRLPVHMHERLVKYRRARRSLERAEGREPTPLEVADHLGWPVSRVYLLERIDKPTVSLDQPVNGQEGTTLAEVIPCPSVAPEQQIADHEVQQRVIELVEELPDREHKVLDRRFGLHGTAGETLEEIGQDLGITRERIRQIEAKGLNKLKHPSRSRRLWEIAGEDGPCPDLKVEPPSNPKSKDGSGESDSGAGNGEVRRVAEQPARRRRKRRRAH